jgi:DNA-binding IscR family transcriptional regulator
LKHQRRFLREENVIMVATIAFGMGIDKPDVRFVAHMDLPKTLEGYYQETGRAGRDGERADAWMVYGLADMVTLRQMLESSDGDERFKRVQQRKMEAMLGFCETAKCRRQVLLAYFGEERPDPCGHCDTCAGKIESWDGTIAAQKALSCVYRTGQRFGAAYLTDVLLGKEDERIRRFGHDRASTFGIGEELSEREWKSVFRQLVAAGLLTIDIEGKGGFRLAPESRQVLNGERKFELRKDPVPVRSKKARKAKRGKAEAPAGAASGELWEKLRALRLELARKQSLAPFVIFHDSTLIEIATRLPRSLEEMREISGIGQRKLDLYGEEFLAAIRDHLGGGSAPSETPWERDIEEDGEWLRRNPGVGSPMENPGDDQRETEMLRLPGEGATRPPEIPERVGAPPPAPGSHKPGLPSPGGYGAGAEGKSSRPACAEEKPGAARLPAPEASAQTPPAQILRDEKAMERLRDLISKIPIKISENSGTDDMLLQIRRKYRRAYEPWSEWEDEVLLESRERWPSSRALAKIFQRQPGAVTARIKRLTGQ